MKITKIETFLVNAGWNTHCFVKTHTDEGVYGIGQAYSAGPDLAVVEVIHDFEAWLLPYWDTIKKLAGHNKTKPSGTPETVNHQNPPAYRIAEIFRLGKRRDFNKRRDSARILEENDLLVSANACPELKAFLNTILQLCGGELIA